MNGTQTFILECGRINSINSTASGEDFDDKSSWTNQIAPILLKRGDQISLQNVLINIGGADTNSIQFQNINTTPTSLIQDNFTLMKIGFYINHNGIYTAALPLKYTDNDTPSATKKLVIDTSTTGNHDGITNRTNNCFGRYQNYQYFGGVNTGDQLLPITSRISRIDSIQSCNPHNPMNGSKFCIIDPNYSGWCRPNSDDGAKPDQVQNIKLLEQDIPILINSGFTSPTGIADLITNILSYTNQNIRDPADTTTAIANFWKQDATDKTDKIPLKQYALNGYTYKTIKANLQGINHKVYGCMGVDEPFLWLYGTQILSNAECDNYTTNKDYFNQITGYPGDARVDYPSIIWQRFIGDDPTLFDLGIEGRTGQYSNYSPFITSSSLASGDPNTLIEITGMSDQFSSFNDYYVNQSLVASDGYYLCQASSNSFRLVRNSVIGTGLDNFGIFVDNDDPSSTKLIAYRRFPSLGGNWSAKEHNIFKTTDVGRPGGSDPYIASGAGAGQPSDNFFSYDADKRTINFGSAFGGLGFTGNVILSNLLSSDSGGIYDGGKYKISFKTEIGDGSSYANGQLIISSNGGIGLTSTTVSTDGNHEISFEAQADNLASDAITFAVNYTNIGCVIKVSNISILRENLEENDTYLLNNAWSNDSTTPENTKIFSYIRSGGLSNVQVIVSGNTFNSDVNRTYTLLTTGLVASLNASTFSLVSGGASFSDIGVYLNDDDPSYSYWLFFFSGGWYVYRLTKYRGGIPTNNTIIGDVTQSASIMKNSPRAGQQYYDFTVGNIWTSPGTLTKYNLASGNGPSGWKDYPPTTLEFYNFIDVVGTTPLGYSYDHTYQRTSPASSNIVYLKTTAETSGLQGTARYETSSGTVGWTGTWVLTTSGGVDGFGALTLTASWGSTVINAQSTLTLASGSHIFNNHITDPLPLVDTDKQYFATVVVSGITYHLGANSNGSGDDTDKEGKRGRLIYSIDGGTTFISSTWNWNGNNLIDLNGNGGNIALTATASTPNLTSVFQYGISQTISSYRAPINGRQYGFNTGLYGTTTTSLVSEPIQYLGFNNTTGPNNTLSITEGFVYDNISDPFASNNGKKWNIRQESNKYVITITDNTDGVVLLTLENNDDTGYLSAGWSLLQTDKKVDYEINGSGANGIIFQNTTKVGYFSNLFSDISNDQIGPQTNDSTGIQYQIYSTNNFASVQDRGTFKTYEGSELTSTNADLKNHQLLMTNLKCTVGNLDKVKQFFRNNEIYDGSEGTRTKISKDTRKFYCPCDLGRSNDDDVDITNTKSSENTTGQTPYIPAYMMDQGIMGVDSGDGDNKNMGCICPTKKTTNGIQNRLNIYTGYEDNYENRIIAEGMYGNFVGAVNYCYGNSLDSTDFQKGYTHGGVFIDTSELYNKCVKDNIGIIPFINKQTGDLMIGFELFDDRNDIFKIQNLTYFVYSPSTVDHKYVSIFNNDAPSQKNDDYNYTGDQRDQMNFIQVGATQPSMVYNQDLNKFTFKYFHTPTFLNKATGTETNIGQEVARLFDNSSMIIFRDFCFPISDKLADDNRRNIGINDSQAGIFLHDIYFQKVQNNFQITRSSDSLAVQMTVDNFYNTIWFKLGFSYFDLKPIRFIENSFNGNRFNNFTYNNIQDKFKKDGLVPFTTNALININFAPLINIFSQNSGDSATESTNVGTEIYGLGFNNNLSSAIEVQSDSLFSTSIPVNITSGYYRIYSDIPCDTLSYTGSGSTLSVIGSALLNYASSQQFFFSYGMDYSATVTKDYFLNNIRIAITNERGMQIKGLGDRSMVVIKITRQIQLSDPPPDPNTKELQDIEKDLEDLVKETKEDNLKDDLKDANNEINQVGIGDAVDSQQRQNNNINTPEEIQAFIDNFNIQMIQNLVNRTLIRVSDDNKNIGKRLATGIAQYFLRKDNVKDFNKITNDLYNKGIDETLKQPYVGKFVDSMNKFYINVEGKALKGSKNQPEIASISDEGAMVLYNEISKAINENSKIKIGGLTSKIFDTVNSLFGTNDIKIFDETDPNIIQAKVEDKNLTVSNFDVSNIKGRGFKDNVRNELKKFYIDSGDIENYLRLYGFSLKGGASEKDRNQALDEIKAEQGNDKDTLKALFKDAGKFILKDNPFAFSTTIQRMNSIIQDILGTNLYSKFSAILEEPENPSALTGVKLQKEKKQFRRTKDEMRETREREEEDKEPNKQIRRKKIEVSEARERQTEDKDAPDSAIKKTDTKTIYSSPVGFQSDKKKKSKSRIPAEGGAGK